MKDKMTIEVNLSKVPLKPYEWDSVSLISGVDVVRVHSKTIHDLYTYDVKIKTDKNVLLLSDTKNSILVKLNDKGNIILRSYLTFKDDLEVCDKASKLSITNLKYEVYDKLNYPSELEEDTEVKSYLINEIKHNKSINKTKYMYYLYFGNINDYSKDKLIKSIKNSHNNKYYKLYKFLTNESCM